MQAAIRIPEPSDNDPDSVATALETAALLVAKGELAEALRWVRRGAESASETGHDVRALALARAAAELSDHLERPSGFAPASHAPEPVIPAAPAAPSVPSLRGPLEGRPVVSVAGAKPASGSHTVARPANAPRPATAASEAATAPPPADYRFDRRSAPPKAPPSTSFGSGAYSTVSHAHAAPSAPAHAAPSAPAAPAPSSPFAAAPSALFTPPTGPLSAERPAPSAPAAERPVEHQTSSIPPASTSTSSFPPPASASDAPPRPRAALRKTARVAVRSAGGTQYVVRTLEEDEPLDPGEQEGLLVLLEPKSRLF